MVSRLIQYLFSCNCFRGSLVEQHSEQRKHTHQKKNIIPNHNKRDEKYVDCRYHQNDNEFV